MFDDLEQAGFAVVPAIVDATTVAGLCEALVDVPDAAGGDRSRGEADAVRDRGRGLYAVRNLLSLSPAVRRLAAEPVVRRLVEPFLGPRARVVRAILFDKTAGANWKVAWHQDLSIAVRQRHEVPGYWPWSVKAGVPHVQPPADLLARMLTVRLHLDDCGPDNGPLRVLPGSHRHGVLSPTDVRDWPSRAEPIDCVVTAGGALLMRPLLLHASSAATAPGHRRVVHLEWSADPLPDPLDWHETPDFEPQD